MILTTSVAVFTLACFISLARSTVAGNKQENEVQCCAPRRKKTHRTAQTQNYLKLLELSVGRAPTKLHVSLLTLGFSLSLIFPPLSSRFVFQKKEANS